jgi:uncharacterized repeat protein (TIGR03803 family)
MRKLKRWKLSYLLLVILIVPAILISSARAQVKFGNLQTFSNNGAGGFNPVGGLILDLEGNLYGTAAGGGTKYEYGGTVFQLKRAPNGKWTENVLYSFAGGDDGQSPLASLVFDASGNLYGTTWGGGTNGAGTVFELTPTGDGSWTKSTLYNFCSLLNCADGSTPGSNLIFDQAGNLYGTTYIGGSTACEDAYAGCGTVFKLTPGQNGTWTESVLYAFCALKNCGDGRGPYFSGVIFDGAGNLYGTTLGGGDNMVQICKQFLGCGVVFELSPSSGGLWNEKVLHTFCTLPKCEDGRSPAASLIFDQSGNLYGTAQAGGTGGGGEDGCGLVFELMPSSDGSWTGQALHNFTSTDGCEPQDSLIFDSAGNLYGTTFDGGSNGVGVVFALVPKSNGQWNDITLHNFFDDPGAIVYAGVVMDSTGNLYGTTAGDGNKTFGSVYAIAP